MPYSGTFTGSGAGAVLLSSGTIAIGAGGATFDFPAGLLQLPGGSLDLDGNTLTNTGSITIDSAATFGIFANNSFSGGNGGNLGGSLINQGTITDSGAGSLQLFDSVALNNTASGTYDFTGDGGFVLGNNSPTIVNAGLFEKTGGTNTSTIDVPFSNTGTAAAGSGTLAFTGSVTQLASNTLTGGTWKALSGATLALPSGTTIATNQATVTLQGTGATLSGLQALSSNTGNLSLLGGAGLTTPGALSNGGSLTLGPASTLTVAGNFTQAASGSLQLQVGGTPASGQFGRISPRARPPSPAASETPWSGRSARRPAPPTRS